MAEAVPAAAIDAILVPSAVLMLLGYHAFLFFKVKRSPCQTAMGVNHKARRLWVKEMLRDDCNNSVLAIQTIRNSIMESTLMATTSVLLIAGLASYFTLANTLNQQPLVVVGVGNTSVLGIVKSLSVLICFLFAFLCHIQSIRFLNHVNYMFNIPLNTPLDTTNHFITEGYIVNLLEHGTILKSVGSRTLYVGFPLLLWLLGSIAMFLCSLILLQCLCYVDFVEVDASAGDHMNGRKKVDDNIEHIDDRS